MLHRTMKSELAVVLLFWSLLCIDANGYPSAPSLGYGYSGTADNYPIVNYPAIQPPGNTYSDQQQIHVPGYKQNNGNGHGYEVNSQPVHGNANNNCCGDGNKIYPPPSGSSDNGKGHASGGYGSSNGPEYTDPCFTKYPNYMIVNAQPYERHSSISIQDCKNICLNNSSSSSVPTGSVYSNNNGQVYRCCSFVYDTQNQICDLYSHIGNAYPSQLTQYYGKDYYEPTRYGGNCLATATVSPVTPVVPSRFTCPADQEARFVKTVGSKSTSTGPSVTIDNISEDLCIDACSKNQASDGRQTLCKSFNYNPTTRQCQINQDSAPSTPTGGVNLVTDSNANYFEKICLDANLSRNCPRILERLPQKVLVGYAEVVTGATSTTDCLQKCLNSQQLFNFNCASGMYYADQTNADTNCILNFETRRTHPELFTDDNNDKVDYFELNCGNTVTTRLSLIRSVNQRRTGFARQISSDPSLTDNKLETPDVDSTDQSRQASFNEWTQWTPCDRNSDGRRVRYRRCSKPNIKDCPLESERCRRETLQSSSRFAIQKDIDEAPISNAKESLCNLDVCCPVLGGCRIGLMRSSADNKLRWCSNPCKEGKSDSF